MKNYVGTINLIEKIAFDTFKIEIKSDLKEANAGQFISILCDNKTLRRPFSIAGFKDNVITVLFKKKGEGTKYISNLKQGGTVDFLAPLGNGFEIKNRKSLLVGAGIGIAPMLFLKDEMNKKNVENYLIAGFKNNNEIIGGAFKTIVGGSVLDDIEQIILNKKIEVIYACGPNIVLKKLSQIALRLNLDCYVAMEKIMACSIGVCRGCVIKLKRDNGTVNAAICKDGPVFKGSEVIWE